MYGIIVIANHLYTLLTVKIPTLLFCLFVCLFCSGQCDQQLEQSSEPVTWSDLKPATADIQQIAESVSCYIANYTCIYNSIYS